MMRPGFPGRTRQVWVPSQGMFFMEAFVSWLLSESPALFLPVSALSALARNHRVPGAQLAIYYDGATTVSEAGELACRTGRRVSRDAAFPVGSITKCFTATVAMILVADGDRDGRR